MLKRQPKSLSELVTRSGSKLGKLANEARRRIDLTEHLRGSLQAPIGEHIVGSNLHDDGTLIVMASGPEWASRLRFESAALLAACRERHPAAMNVRIRVAHEEHAGGA